MFNKAVAIGLLSRASNGDDLLAILDSLAADEGNTEQEEIQFWYYNIAQGQFAYTLPLYVWQLNNSLSAVYGGRCWYRRGGEAMIKKGSFLTYRGDKSTSIYQYNKKISGQKNSDINLL